MAQGSVMRLQRRQLQGLNQVDGPFDQRKDVGLGRLPVCSDGVGGWSHDAFGFRMCRGDNLVRGGFPCRLGPDPGCRRDISAVPGEGDDRSDQCERYRRSDSVGVL